MATEIGKLLGSLPKIEASFVEPMECLSVSKLPGLRSERPAKTNHKWGKEKGTSSKASGCHSGRESM
jgi:hypothetical protein